MGGASLRISKKIVTYKQNLSALANSYQLQEVCSREVRVNSINIDPDPRIVEEFTRAVFKAPKTDKSMVDKWESLFGTN